MTNATFLTMKPGETKPVLGYMLVGDDGKIATLAAGAPPAGTTADSVIDGTNRIIVPGFITDGDCSSAVEQYLSVGATVITQLDGTLAMRDTPTAEFPTAQVASGVTGKISEGPLCHKGFRMWKVAFSSGQTGWVPDSYGGNLYLKKN